MRLSLAVSPVVLAAVVAVSVTACGGGEGARAKGPRAGLVTAMSQAAPKADASAPALPREDSSLLSRRVLFANPDRARPLLSPDGKQLAYLSDVDGVLNVWVAPVGDLAKAKAVTQDKKRGIRTFEWAFTNAHLLYLQDQDGDENWHLHAVDLRSGKDLDLTPAEGAQARIEALSHRVPKQVVVGLNDRDKRHHDLYRVDIATGDKTLVLKNDGFASFALDDAFVVRLAERPQKDGGVDVQEPDGKGGFRSAYSIPLEDTLTTRIAGFDKAAKKAFLLDSRGRDTAALVELDLASKKTKVLLDDGQADIRELVVHPTEKKVQAALASFDRLRWHVLDPSLAKDLEILGAAAPGDLGLVSRSLDDATWIVSATVSDGPVRFFSYDRKKKKAEFLFSNVKAFEDEKLAKMHPRVLKSRDGLDLVSYLSLPRASDPDGDGQPDRALPMVLFVHGGPWSRDEYGLNRYHQWLAARGYAVLSVNYRGSVGFGKAFVNAADRQWAAKMHDDLVDAVSWAVTQKIADKDRVAIMGGSYGGYATLVGLTFTPETFACGVDIVGPSNLVTLLESIPPYWEVEVEQFTKRIGDHRTEEGKKLLASRSPLSFVDRIKRPLLIGQGRNDPRVKQAESDQIVRAMQEKKIPVTYVLYPDEGHGFARPENRTSFNAVAEIFLAQCLGGPYEPIGKDFEGASITVPAGKEHVHTLAGALK
jgi:dipeptidyl aminopeptidase/acylaminoacyl peptidase